MRKIDLKEYKKIVLNVLVSVDKICRENQLRYMIFYGTLLGAVRHQGFIPWDDDIDIIMPREDYEKLRDIISTNDYGLRFICPETTPDTIYPYGKVCDSKTRLKEKNFVEVEGYGAYVDIFPMDYLPESEQERERLNKRYVAQIKLLMHSTRTGYCKSSSTATNIRRFAAFYICKLINTHKMVGRLNEEFKALNKTKTQVIGLPWAMRKFLAKDTDFEEAEPIMFEGHSLMGPKDPDRFLRELYGDYMKLPPADKQVSDHSFECYYLD